MSDSRMGSSNAFERVRNVLQDIPVSKKIKYSDIAGISDDVEELLSRRERLQALGSDYAHVEISPYLARAARVVRARKIVEQLIDDAE